jgi:hypothetical protein
MELIKCDECGKGKAVRRRLARIVVIAVQRDCVFWRYGSDGVIEVILAILEAKKPHLAGFVYGPVNSPLYIALSQCMFRISF